jgi:hypothetical protein
MARSEITVTKITSDLTGREDSEANAPAPVKVSVNGKSATLDLFSDELAALEMLVNDKSGSALRKLFTPAPVKAGRPRAASGSAAVPGSGQAKHSPEEIQGAKDHMASVGSPYSGKGKIPTWAYDRTQPPAAAAPTEPAAGS